MTDNLRVIKLSNSGPETRQSTGTGYRHDMKSRILFSFLGVVSVAICMISYFWFVYSVSHISTNDAYVEAEVWQVNSRNIGYVKAISISENEHVKKGQILAQLDDSDVEIELRYKKAKYDKTLADVQRARSLNQSRLISASDLETAEATLTAMLADLDGSLLKKSFTQIMAASDGVIGRISIHPGQFVQPGQSLMLLVVDGDLWIKANYKETDLSKVKRGMEVQVSIDAFPGEIWKGEVESIYPTSGASVSLIPPENATGNFTKIVQRIPIKIKLIQKPGIELRSGMSAMSTIVVR